MPEPYFLSAFADEISPDIDIQLATLKRLGVGGLDLRSVGNVNVLLLSDQQVLDVRDKCQDAGIIPQAVGSPLNKVQLAAQNREKEMAKLRRSAEVAHLLGVTRVRIFTPEVPGGQFEESWPEVRDWMREQADFADQEGIVLLHENDARFFGAYPENAKRLLGEFGSANFVAAFDFANTVLLGFRPWDDWFPWILPHLDTIHIKDANLGGAIVPAGQGDGQFEEVFRFLVEQGWSGTLTMEPHLSAAGKFGGFSGDQLFETAVAALRKVLDSVGAVA